MSIVGRLGLGAWSWVRIRLGDKVRVSISYYLKYTKHIANNLGPEFGGLPKNKHDTFIVQQSVNQDHRSIK